MRASLHLNNSTHQEKTSKPKKKQVESTFKTPKTSTFMNLMGALWRKTKMEDAKGNMSVSYL